MITIEVDEEVFDHLKSLAEPFVDTPNSVLRRIIFPNAKSSQLVTSTRNRTPSVRSEVSNSPPDLFMATFLQKRYEENFRSRRPYRTMFESENRLVYFQNFNKAETTNLWYRLSESSLSTLRNTSKSALVCLANPAANIVFEIPVKDIDDQISKSKWGKTFLEVNIDPASARWRELDWNIEKYLIKNNE